jgi:hypothetical protein
LGDPAFVADEKARHDSPYPAPAPHPGSPGGGGVSRGASMLQSATRNLWPNPACSGSTPAPCLLW